MCYPSLNKKASNTVEKSQWGQDCRGRENEHDGKWKSGLRKRRNG